MAQRGRPKGSRTRPQLLDYYSDKELEEFFTGLKEDAKKDPMLKKFVAEQLLGKAIQPVEGEVRGDIKVLFDNAFIAPETKANS